MSLKSSLAAAKSLTEAFAGLAEAEAILTDAVKAEALLGTYKKQLADLAAEVNAAADDKSKAHKDAELIRAEAKALRQAAQDEVNKTLAEAKGEAIAITAKAKEEAKALLEVARGKVQDQEAKAAALEKRVADLHAAAADAEARLVKAKEAVAKLLG